MGKRGADVILIGKGSRRGAIPFPGGRTDLAWRRSKGGENLPSRKKRGKYRADEYLKRSIGGGGGRTSSYFKEAPSVKEREKEKLCIRKGSEETASGGREMIGNRGNHLYPPGEAFFSSTQAFPTKKGEKSITGKREGVIQPADHLARWKPIDSFAAP